jgi:hypothetical protein
LEASKTERSALGESPATIFNDVDSNGFGNRVIVPVSGQLQDREHRALGIGRAYARAWAISRSNRW